jgi:RNA polymerase sigma factor (sigma-70 family)
LSTGPVRVADLVRAWQRREPESIDRLVPALRANLLPIARMILRDRQAAEDAFIKTVTQVLEHLDNVDPEAALGYGRRAMRSSSIDILRSRQVRDMRSAQRGADGIRRADPSRSTEPVERLAGKVTNPENKALRQEMRRRILSAVAGLKEPRRSVVRLHLVEGHTLDECAEAIGLSRTSVKRHLRAGRARLARELRDLREGGPDGV